MSKLANLRLTAKLLPIIVPFMAKNDIRYYLNAINVRPHKDGGAIIVATNGHALGAIHDRDAVCDEEVILRFDARMAQACAASRKNEREVVVIGDRLAVVENGSSEIYIQAGRPDIEAQYPKYQRLIPNQADLQPGLVGTFGGPLIALADKAAVAAARAFRGSVDRYVGVQFFNKKGDPNSSAVFRLVDAPDFVGVLMPMRHDSMSPTPKWVSSMPAADDLAEMTKSAASVPEGVPA